MGKFVPGRENSTCKGSEEVGTHFSIGKTLKTVCRAENLRSWRGRQEPDHARLRGSGQGLRNPSTLFSHL